MKETKERILILGGSGFLGHALYRELQSYYDVHATFYSQIGSFSENQAYHHFSLETDSVWELLEKIEPTVIISALKGSYLSLSKLHLDIKKYLLEDSRRRFIYFSSAAVFDGKTFFPAYDNDTPLAASKEGKDKIALEKIVFEGLPDQVAILRLPIVLGVNSPLIFHLRQCIKNYAAFEVFPNLIVTATTINKVKQQVHYIINRDLSGIFHLASVDMIHHDELFHEITHHFGSKLPIFKNVFSSNEDRYRALLPRINKLPETYEITIAKVIEESGLAETSTIF
ncbi:MAG TPA: dTDP-4-dehydrorhamnose reductase [Flavobacteriaceae bacterium]|nr:dTDP-4-dehydrorhamnose reductase [Flavobacteriaceae bacterium]